MAYAPIQNIDWLAQLNENFTVIENAELIELASEAEVIAGVDATKGVTPAGIVAMLAALDFPINMEGLVLPSNSNAIRGANIDPNRVSGWTSFSGNVTTTPAQVYSDFRQLKTSGVAEVLGFGSFPTMLSGASCKSLFGGQDIAQVDTGATILSAAGEPAIGIFARFFKTLLDGSTFTPGGVAAVQFLSFQANVVDVQAQDTSIWNVEVASGGIRSVLKFHCSAAKGATYLLDIVDDNGEPASVTNGSTLADISATINAGWIRVRVGGEVRYIPLYEAKAE
jgi:hypothetical protein